MINSAYYNLGNHYLFTDAEGNSRIVDTRRPMFPEVQLIC